MSININSLVSKDKQANILQASKRYVPDAILVTETRLDNKNQLEFANYECVRTDKHGHTKGRGTAILIKKKY